MSKYEPLWSFIKEKGEEEYELFFLDIEKILGFSIDHAFLTYKKELKDYGYEVKRIAMKDRIVYIKKI